jgi:hypothetical protein
MAGAGRLNDMTRIFLAVTAAVIVSNCASAQPEPDLADLNSESATQSESVELAENAEPAQNAEPSGKDELICTREAITGSHMKTKVCLTREQREEGRRASQAFIDKIKRSPATSIDSGG